MGAALQMLSEQMKMPPMPERAMPPVLVLISDGQPSDDVVGGLHTLLAQPWGRKAVRVAVAVGHDADQSILQQFCGRDDLAPLQANNPAALVQQIKWISTAVLQSASAPAQPGADTQPIANIPIPAPPTSSGGPSIW
jgi:uncharacterized protein YegL